MTKRQMSKKRRVKKRLTKAYCVKHAIRDKTYKEFKRVVNMTHRELLVWSRSPCSRKASLSRRPVKQTLELLKTPKHKWTLKHIRFANRTISFIKRIKKTKADRQVSKDCPFSKKTISLKNYGFNPNK